MRTIHVRVKRAGWLTGLVLFLGACIAFVVIPRLEGTKGHAPAQEFADAGDRQPCLHREGSNTLLLSRDLVERMALKTSVTRTVDGAIGLPAFQGVLAVDNDRLSRIHSRFAGEVVALGHSTDGSDPTIHVGEKVRRGDLLAVVWSSDLGQKKSDFVNALTKLHAEEELRDRLKRLWDEGAGAGRPYRDAEKDVQARLVEVVSIERVLQTWRVTDDEIAELRAEAKHLVAEQQPMKDPSTWARVEIRAPISGMILEKNAIVGDMVEPDTDLFKIGDLSHLAVWAHVFEEDIPLVETLSLPAPWTVTLPSRPDARYQGQLDKLGAVIDPAQHTALLVGQVENSRNELKVGQLVKVTLQLPSAGDVVELPATAVVEDGRQSVVFVQTDADGLRFDRRSVHVVRRLRDVICVRAADDEISAGQQVVSAGALMLLHAMNQAPSANASSSSTANQLSEAQTFIK